jgi:hypothetical protein
MVVSFPYPDDAKLTSIVDEIERINIAACPLALSFRTYELTHDERTAAEGGILDVITGCQLIDGTRRIFFLEGVAGKAITALRHLLPRSAMNSDTFSILANPTVIFHRRLYTCFNIAPRYIRLRILLRDILENPGTYDAENLSRELMDTLESLHQATRARDLLEAKTFEFFPSADGLLELENKYGGPVSLVDVFGASHPDAHAMQDKLAALKSVESTSAQHLAATVDVTKLLSSTFVHTFNAGLGVTAGVGNDATVPTDKVGPDREHSASRHRNFVAENIETLHQASMAAHKSKHSPQGASEWVSFPVEGPVVSYSGQKLNSMTAQMDALRRHLAEDKRATFTTSLEFVSQTIGLVDPNETSKRESQLAKSKWKTPKGFVYPAPRPASSYVIHPDRLTEARGAGSAAPLD